MLRRTFLATGGTLALAGCLGSNTVHERIYSRKVYAFELEERDTLIIEITVEEGTDGVVQVNRRSLTGEVLLDERTETRGRWELEAPYSDVYRVLVLADEQIFVDIRVENRE